MKNYAYHLIVLEIIYFILLFILPIVLIKNHLGSFNLSSNRLLPFPEITSTFSIKLSDNQYLNSISFELKNPMLLSHQQIDLSFLDTSGQQLHNLSFFGSQVGDPSRLDIKIPPINPPLDKTIVIKLSSPEVTQHPLHFFTNSNSLPLYYTTHSMPLLPSLRLSISNLVNTLCQISQPHLYLYFFILFYLNLLIIIDS